MKITILCDNNVARSGILAEHGFSALIEINNTKYLFDTGASGHVVAKNSLILGIDLKEIDSIIISHGHYDHAGGLEEILKITGKKSIIANQQIFQDKYSIRNDKKVFSGIKYKKAYLENTLGADFNFIKGFTRIKNNVYLTGIVPMNNEYEKIPPTFKTSDEKGNIIHDNFQDENSLVIDTEKGLVVITGCAHRGVVNIIQFAQTQLNKDIFAIVGGMHLIGCKDDHFNHVTNFIKEQNVPFIYPSHCTGFKRICELKSFFPTKVYPAFSGEIISIT